MLTEGAPVTSQQASSFEALCQAARSELQNISNSKHSGATSGTGQLQRTASGQVQVVQGAKPGQVLQLVKQDRGLIELKPAASISTGML